MKRLLLIAFALSMFTLFYGCSEDETNSPPATGTLTGNAIFYGEWPDTGTVQLSIFTSWNNEANCYWCAQSAGGPPAYYTPSGYFVDPNPNNGAGPDTVPFAIEGIALGTYEVVVTGWRNPVRVGNVECDEPVTGMYGAEPLTSDTIPDGISFSSDTPVRTIEMVTRFDHRLPVAGCGDLGRVDGTISLSGTWPAAGVAAIITTMPYTAWQPEGLGGYRGRDPMLSSTDNYFTFSQPYGTYYVSLWTNELPPNNKFLGAWGVNTAAGDARPNLVTIATDAPHSSLSSVSCAGNPLHWVSGTITFNGTRPAEGLLVFLSHFWPPQGPPSGMMPLTDANENLYAVSGFTGGSYFVSLWKNSQTERIFYGVWYDPDGGDTEPDAITFDTQNLGVNGVNITGLP